MTKETLKVIIPMAGFGTRLRPHTWSKPKTLMRIGAKTVLDYVLDMLKTLPEPENIELVFIVGYLGDQFKPYMDEHYPDLKVHYVEQPEMRGQSHAIYLARDVLSGPMLMVFADTLIESNLSLLADETIEGIAWVKQVPDPRRFGVAVVDEDGWVTRLVEKPAEMDNNLVVVGFYYFKHSEDLLSAIEEQMRRGVQLKGEYFLADAINIMLERGLKMSHNKVDVWLDAGVPATILETNRYLLEHGSDNSSEITGRDTVAILPPVYVHPSASLHASVIGPHASIGPGCVVEGSLIRDSILEDSVRVTNALLEGSLLGRNADVSGGAVSVNIGDHSSAKL